MSKPIANPFFQGGPCIYYKKDSYRIENCIRLQKSILKLNGCVVFRQLHGYNIHTNLTEP